MNSYKTPLNDIRFALFDVLGADKRYPALGFEHADRDMLDAALDEAARFCEQVLAPLNQSGDEIGCVFDSASGSVTTPPGFKKAYEEFVSGGWAGISAPEDMGGMNLPQSFGVVMKEMIDSANLSWGNYPLLSHGAIEAIKELGEPWQKDIFLKKIVDGTWTGTMCLTEPHCGTDLGLLKTKAEPQADGSYTLSGTKIFITGGDHDLTENIVHLVLARLPDAPAGTKGISLFIVPKFHVAKDGTVGAQNALRCGSIEHKMGIHGSATCVMNFDGAQGYLIGQPNKGLAGMFIMMNSARLAVGVQGLGLMERAYQNALTYSKDRLQMRAPTGAKFPDKAADPIIVHPDVRRMLLTCKALTEGGRLMALDAALLLDVLERDSDEHKREQAEQLLSFLTPIVKGCLTEWSVECTYHALQCFGGHGYVKEWGMEQLARDARITTIYEGTTQIQALDLLGRKIIAMKGAGLQQFIQNIQTFCEANKANPALADFNKPLAESTRLWGELTMEIARKSQENADELGAASVDYLFFSGYVVLAYWWARSVETSHGKNNAKAKLETARFYYARILPRIASHAAGIRAGSASLMNLDADLF